MNREMTALALGGKCGFLGNSGESAGTLAASSWSCFRRSRRAKLAMPPPNSHRKCRLDSKFIRVSSKKAKDERAKAKGRQLNSRTGAKAAPSTVGCGRPPQRVPLSRLKDWRTE